MTIRAKAPLRLSFAGGGTDVPPFPAEEGGAVLSTTMDTYAYGSLTPREDSRACIRSIDLGLRLDLDLRDELDQEGELSLVKAAVRRLADGHDEGFDLTVRSAVPPGSGLGSSSTLMVVLVALLGRHFNLPLDEYETARLAHEIERSDLGISGGLQDHYAAVFGGFNFMQFASDHVVVNPLRIRDEIADELQMSLFLCFTGKTRNSAHIIDDQTSRVTGQSMETLSALRRQKEIAEQMKRQLLLGRLTEFGWSLDEAWKEKQRMSPLIATEDILRAYDIAVRGGALGGKVTGAGGGGHIMFFCDFDRKYQVMQSLVDEGYTVSEIAFDASGVRTWKA